MNKIKNALLLTCVPLAMLSAIFVEAFSNDYEPEKDANSLSIMLMLFLFFCFVGFLIFIRYFANINGL